jgi:hypothetical protein
LTPLIRFLAARGVDVEAGQAESSQSRFQFGRGNTEVDEGPQQHVAADAAADVEEEDGHGSRG